MDSKETKDIESHPANQLVAGVFIDLIREKNKNRLFTFAYISAAVVIVFLVLLFSWGLYIDITGTQYAVSAQGNVYKLEKAKVVTELPEEAKFQSAYFFNTYYTYHFGNMKIKREAALWVIDEEEGKLLEEKWQSWYTTVSNQSLIQKAVFDESTFQIRQISEDVYQIYAVAQLEVTNAGFMNIYELSFTTYAKRVERVFPRNPHGFMFYNFSDKLELKEENIEVKTRP